MQFERHKQPVRLGRSRKVVHHQPVLIRPGPVRRLLVSDNRRGKTRAAVGGFTDENVGSAIKVGPD